MSTRTHAVMPPMIRVTAVVELTAIDDQPFTLTVTELGDGFWKYSLTGGLTESGLTRAPRTARLGHGRLHAPGHLAALGKAAALLADGYPPGSAEHDILTDLTTDGPARVLVKAVAALDAGRTQLSLTVNQLGVALWSYNLSYQGRSNRAGYGYLHAPDHLAALRAAATGLADGYPPGSTEHDLLEQLCQHTSEPAPQPADSYAPLAATRG